MLGWPARPGAPHRGPPHRRTPAPVLKGTLCYADGSVFGSSLLLFTPLITALQNRFRTRIEPIIRKCAGEPALRMGRMHSTQARSEARRQEARAAASDGGSVQLAEAASWASYGGASCGMSLAASARRRATSLARLAFCAGTAPTRPPGHLIILHYHPSPCRHSADAARRSRPPDELRR
jgi:hypothetical protein